VQNADPYLIWNETDQAANGKIWDAFASSGTFYMRLVNDAYSAATNWLQVTRSGTTVSSVSFPNGNVGIGTASPGYKLDVVSAGTGTARFGTASGDSVVVGGGAGKLDVGTVDPIYDINGVKYATYLPGMVGQKEEAAGTLNLRPTVNNSKLYEYVIDFDNFIPGDDLWLFRKITDFSVNWNNLAVLLTPNFAGQVWYKKNPGKNQLIIFALPLPSNLEEGQAASVYEVGYRLTAPRFDWASWTNFVHDQGLTGFMIKEK
jgi:hypothetical protein